MNEAFKEILSGGAAGRKIGREAALRLLELAERRPHKSGDCVFLEGDPAAGLFIVAAGSLRLSRYASDGRESVLHLAKPPDIIAEAAIFLGRYPATATAAEDCELLFVRRERVLEMIGTSGPFALFMVETLSHWLKRLVEKIDSLTLSDATARVARHLLSLHESEPPGLSSSAPTVTLTMKKGDLAGLLNMHPPSLSRILRRLQDQGVIDVRRNSVRLLDLGALRRLSLPPVG